MQNYLIIAILLGAGILSAILIDGMNIINFSQSKNGFEILSFTTDKELYHSNEPMNMSLVISASNNMNNVTVNVFGIKDRSSNYRINRLETVNLTNGINIFTYSYTTPSCYGCAGIDAGVHDITAIVSYQEISLNSTIKIDIKS